MFINFITEIVEMLYCMLNQLAAGGSNWSQNNVRTNFPALRAALIGCWQPEREGRTDRQHFHDKEQRSLWTVLLDH